MERSSKKFAGWTRMVLSDSESDDEVKEIQLPPAPADPADSGSGDFFSVDPFQIKIEHGSLTALSRMARPTETKADSCMGTPLHLATKMWQISSSRGPNHARTFDSFCYFCSNPLHSQKWCPLRYC